MKIFKYSLTYYFEEPAAEGPYSTKCQGLTIGANYCDAMHSIVTAYDENQIEDVVLTVFTDSNTLELKEDYFNGLDDAAEVL